MSALNHRDEINLSETTVAVYGLGKMGLPLAGVLADEGADVVGVDIDEGVVESINSGTSPVENEPGLSELVGRYGGEELEATTDGGGAARRADVMIVLVPTVVDEEFEPILEPVLDVADDIRQGVDEGDLVVLESTVPPGTTANEFKEGLEPEGLVAGDDFGVAHCPERTSSGRVIEDVTESYPKIVGGIDDDSTRLAASLYHSFNQPGVIEMSSATAAEAVKVFEGVYRDTNIALANELAKACEEWGLDSEEVFEAANSQPYCAIHVPGCGVGGHCIPVYPHFVIDRAEETPLLEVSRRVNDGMPRHTVGILESLLEGQGAGLKDSSVLVMGITYRPGVRETRFAPAVDIIEVLDNRGAEVYAHDPLLSREEVEELGAEYTEVKDAEVDAVVLATGHEEYHELDMDALEENVETGVFVDGRSFFEPENMEGFVYATVGRGEGQG
jgi:nucleotide sugar dehydrogenase